MSAREERSGTHRLDIPQSAEARAARQSPRRLQPIEGTAERHRPAQHPISRSQAPKCQAQDKEFLFISQPFMRSTSHSFPNYILSKASVNSQLQFLHLLPMV